MASNTPSKTRRISSTETDYGGYDHEFTEDIPQKYMCVICSCVQRDPHLTSCCGQHFCCSCLRYWVRKNHRKICPYCRARPFIDMLDKQQRREINEFKIHCSNQDEGCQWMGELGSLQCHLDAENGCDYVNVNCTKCQKKMKRKDMRQRLGLRRQVSRPLTFSIPQSQLSLYGHSVMFAMENFPRYFEMNDYWYSPPFYYREGYKLCLAVHARGIRTGSESHVSLSLLLMQGEVDDQLTWPIGHQEDCICITMLPHNSNSMPRLLPTVWMKTFEGCWCSPPNCHIGGMENTQVLGSKDTFVGHKEAWDLALPSESVAFKVLLQLHCCH